MLVFALRVLFHNTALRTEYGVFSVTFNLHESEIGWHSDEKGQIMSGLKTPCLSCVLMVF